MADIQVTATNARTGKEIQVPAPGRIVRIAYDVPVRHDGATRRGQDAARWQRKDAIGIVMRHGREWDAFARAYAPALGILTTSGKTDMVILSHIVKVTSTRSIPAEARKALTSIYRWKSKEEREWDERIREMQERKRAACAAAGADDIEKTIAAAMGSLTEREFEEAIRGKLAKRFPTLAADGWSVSMWHRHLSVTRMVELTKYYSGSLSSIGYDGRLELVEDAERTEEGMRILRRERRTLPLRAELEERLTLEDKNWLTYWGTYELGDLGDDPLTEALADKVVSGICG